MLYVEKLWQVHVLKKGLFPSQRWLWISSPHTCFFPGGSSSAPPVMLMGCLFQRAGFCTLPSPCDAQSSTLSSFLEAWALQWGLAFYALFLSLMDPSAKRQWMPQWGDTLWLWVWDLPQPGCKGIGMLAERLVSSGRWTSPSKSAAEDSASWGALSDKKVPFWTHPTPGLPPHLCDFFRDGGNLQP